MVLSLFHLLRNISLIANNFIEKPENLIQFQVHVPDCGDVGGNHMFLLFKEADGSPEIWEEENNLHWVLCDRNFKPFADSFRRGKCTHTNVIVFINEGFHHDDNYGNSIINHRLYSPTVHKYILLC